MARTALVARCIAMQGRLRRGTDWSAGTGCPYARSIFDYVGRGMPPFSLNQLLNDDVYSVTAYIFYLNDVIGSGDIMERGALSQIKERGRSQGMWIDTHEPY